ncbi:MAG TPA: Spy/CpxP family protein refolding chaperone [Planctomycetota bacterium]|nr:Spy/CpxP family protein refolding chaperone [Planctomycetota bacterium]HRR80588.1 Spy/CpxP family protein refolding chaperone [Planctomycetota bacterium]
MGGPREADLFDVARRLATLADDKKAALGNLEIEYAFAENDAMAEVRRRLNKEFLARIVALLPDEEKPKYEKAIAAMTERDEAIAAAEKELREVLAKVKTSQGADKVVAQADPNQRFFRMRPGDVPTRKMDALRTCFVLTDDQRKEIEVIRDGNRDAVREKMRAQFANLRGADGGRPDPEQFRRMAPLFRQVRTETDDADAKMAANLLTDAQKKDFATVCAAIDTYNKKVADAEAACRAKVTEAVGADKANAILGYTAAAAAQAAPAAKGTEF